MGPLDFLKSAFWILRQLMARDAYARAVRRTQDEFYTLRWYIPRFIEMWRRDEDVSVYLAGIRDGTLHPDVPEPLVQIFVAHAGAISLNPTTAAAILKTFVGHFQQERFKDEDGRSVLARQNRADSERILGALSEVKAAVSLGPPSRAASSYRTDQRTDAIDVPVEETPPDADDSWHREIDKARTLVGDGAPRSALRLLKGIEIDLPPAVSDEIRYRLAMNKGACLVMLNRLEEANREFDEALMRKPDDPKALEQAAQARFHVGDEQRAEELARSAIGQKPDAELAWAVLVRIDPETKVPHDVDGSSSVQMARGLVALSQLRAEDAVSFFRAALDAKPDDPQIKILLADALYMSWVDSERSSDVHD